jgi:DNA polymerase III epsilon subunit-like protein
MIVLDVETTGLEPKVHSIISIGAVDTNKLINELPNPLFYRECTIWLGAEIQEEIKEGRKVFPALEVNGFEEEQARYTNPETHDDVMKAWMFWTKDSENRTLCGENINFDMGFVKEGLIRAGYEEKEVHKLIGARGIDIHTISYESHEKNGIAIPMKNSRSNLSLNETLKYCGLPPEADPHNGLIGAILEAETKWRITFGQSLFAKIPLSKIIPEQFPKDRLGDIPHFAGYPLPSYLIERKHRYS